MPNQNRCITYFSITGDFDPDMVTSLLQIKPECSWKIGDLRANGTRYDFSAWHGPTCREYDWETGNQMRKAIAPFVAKTALLNRLLSERSVMFTLEVVPELVTSESTPALAPPLDVIDFCHATRTRIDIDLYLHEE